MELSLRPPILAVDLGAPHRVLSWALVGGGLREAQAVVWRQVRDGDLGLDVDAGALLRGALRGCGRPEAVGLLTSASVSRVVHRHAELEHQGERAAAECVATVGLGNRLRIGDPPGLAPVAGTINLLVQVGQPLSAAALLEVLSLAVEARTLAVHELGVASVRSGDRATGTGTDCVVVAAPLTGAAPLAFAGKHTAIGSAVGRCVLDAVRAGGRACLESP